MDQEAACFISLTLAAMRTSSGLLCVTAMVVAQFANGQFNTLSSVHGRTNVAITGVSIGNVTAPPTGIAFQVRGDLLGAGSTGEVFRTNAPAANNTFWRLFSGGTGTANERGNLFAETGLTRFNVNAPNGQLRLMTNTLPRLRVNETGNYLGLGNFTGINADGFVLISPNNNFSANAFGPYSRLHLAEGVLGQNTQQTGYRPWMRNGITFTGNNDQMYIGALYRGLDYSDCVVNWSDNPGSQIGDRMRFLFTSGNTVTTDTMGADGLYGLEAMRMKPVEGGSEIFVGVGDYQRTGTDPKERFEVLDRTIRIDSLIPDYRNDTLTRVVMVV